MGFIRQILWSIYSPPFYSNVVTKSFGSAFKYYFLFSLVVILLSSIVPSFTLLTSFGPELQKMVDKARGAYPQELEVKIKNGIVTTNVSEPYFIAPFEGDGDKKNLIVIDTKTPFSSTQFNNYNTTVWVTKDSVFMKGDNQLRTYDLSEVKDFTINRNKVNEWISVVDPWVKFVTPVVIVFMILGLIMLTLFRLVYLFFLALLIWLLIKILKKNFSYMTSYKIGLHAVTLPMIIDALTFFTGTPHVPFLFTIIALVVVFLNLHKYQPSKKS